MPDPKLIKNVYVIRVVKEALCFHLKERRYAEEEKKDMGVEGVVRAVDFSHVNR